MYEVTQHYNARKGRRKKTRYIRCQPGVRPWSSGSKFRHANHCVKVRFWVCVLCFFSVTPSLGYNTFLMRCCAFFGIITTFHREISRHSRIWTKVNLPSAQSLAILCTSSLNTFSPSCCNAAVYWSDCTTRYISDVFRKADYSLSWVLYTYVPPFILTESRLRQVSSQKLKVSATEPFSIPKCSRGLSGHCLANLLYFSVLKQR